MKNLNTFKTLKERCHTKTQPKESNINEPIKKSGMQNIQKEENKYLEKITEKTKNIGKFTEETILKKSENLQESIIKGINKKSARKKEQNMPITKSQLENIKSNGIKTIRDEDMSIIKNGDKKIKIIKVNGVKKIQIKPEKLKKELEANINWNTKFDWLLLYYTLKRKNVLYATNRFHHQNFSGIIGDIEYPHYEKMPLVSVQNVTDCYTYQNWRYP